MSSQLHVKYAQGLLSEWSYSKINKEINKNLKRNCLMSSAVVTDSKKSLRSWLNCNSFMLLWLQILGFTQPSI